MERVGLFDKERARDQSAARAEPERAGPDIDPRGAAARGQAAELQAAADGASGAPRSLEEVAAGAALESGARGPAVKALQALLGAPQTGAFDDATVDAVKAFQVEAKLTPVSGRVGPTTLAALRARSEGPSKDAAAQMERLVAIAEANNVGASKGDCFKFVWRYLVKAQYGRIRSHGDAPQMKSDYARQFAEFMNSGDNAKRWGLRRLSISSPYQAPRGAVVVVGPGTPGTRHAVAGDIAVARGDGTFINDGPRMSYGPPERFAADGGTLLGAYVPDS